MTEMDADGGRFNPVLSAEVAARLVDGRVLAARMIGLAHELGGARVTADLLTGRISVAAQGRLAERARDLIRREIEARQATRR